MTWRWFSLWSLGQGCNIIQIELEIGHTWAKGGQHRAGPGDGACAVDIGAGAICSLIFVMNTPFLLSTHNLFIPRDLTVTEYNVTLKHFPHSRKQNRSSVCKLRPSYHQSEFSLRQLFIQHISSQKCPAQKCCKYWRSTFCPSYKWFMDCLYIGLWCMMYCRRAVILLLLNAWEPHRLFCNSNTHHTSLGTLALSYWIKLPHVDKAEHVWMDISIGNDTLIRFLLFAIARRDFSIRNSGKMFHKFIPRYSDTYFKKVSIDVELCSI